MNRIQAQQSLSPGLVEKLQHFGVSLPLQEGLYLTFPTQAIRPSKENARTEAINMRHVSALIKSMQTTGLIVPISVQEILPSSLEEVLEHIVECPDGGHRFLAAQALGSESLPVYMRGKELSGRQISSATDSQVKFSSGNNFTSISKAFELGASVDEISAVSRVSKGTIREKVRLARLLSPEVQWVVKQGEKNIKLGHVKHLAVLPEHDQNYFLAKALQGGISLRNLAKNVESYHERLQREKPELLRRKGISIDELPPQKEAIESLVIGDFIEKHKLPLLKGEEHFKMEQAVSAFSFSSEDEEKFKEQERRTLQERKERISKRVFSRISRLYQLGLVVDEDLERVDNELDTLITSELFRSSEISLREVIQRYSERNPLEERICNFNEAREVLLKRAYPKQEIVDLAFPLQQAVYTRREVRASSSNARGDLEKTLSSCTLATMKNIVSHGIIQPPLAYRTQEGDIEIVCGNRRYWTLRLCDVAIKESERGYRSAFKSLIEEIIETDSSFSKQEIQNLKSRLDEAREVLKALPLERKEENVRKIPLLIINQDLSELDKLLLQIAENSQRPFSRFERAAQYERQYLELANGKGSDALEKETNLDSELVKRISRSTPYSAREVDLLIRSWRDISKAVRGAYIHGNLISSSNLDELLEIEPERREIICTQLALRRTYDPQISPKNFKRRPFDSFFEKPDERAEVVSAMKEYLVREIQEIRNFSQTS